MKTNFRGTEELDNFYQGNKGAVTFLGASLMQCRFDGHHPHHLHFTETLCPLMSSVDALYKHFRPRSSTTLRGARSESNLFDIQIIFRQEI